MVEQSRPDLQPFVWKSLPAKHDRCGRRIGTARLVSHWDTGQLSVELVAVGGQSHRWVEFRDVLPPGDAEKTIADDRWIWGQSLGPFDDGIEPAPLAPGDYIEPRITWRCSKQCGDEPVIRPRGLVEAFVRALRSNAKAFTVGESRVTGGRYYIPSNRTPGGVVMTPLSQ